MTDIEVGTMLYYEPSDKRWQKFTYMRVTGVGRKWIELDNGKNRAHIDTLLVDGGKYSSPGRCWLSKEEYEIHRFRSELWSHLRGSFTHASFVPDFLTSNDILKVYDILKLTIPKHIEGVPNKKEKVPL